MMYKLDIRQWKVMMMMRKLGFIDMIYHDEFDTDGKVWVDMDVSENIK